MSEVTRKQLQPPFRQQDLIYLDGFITHCRKYGVLTSREELEYLDKESILLPAVRVNPGIVVLRRAVINIDNEPESDWDWRFVYEKDLDKIAHKEIDPKIYYEVGSTSRHRPGNWETWLNDYTVLFPAEHAFRPWIEYTEQKRMDDFTTNRKEVENIWDAYYSPLQLYTVRLAHQMTNELTYRVKKDEIRNAMREVTLKYHRFFKLVDDVEDLWDLKKEKEEQFFTTALKDNDKDWKAAQADLRAYSPELGEELKSKAKSIFEKHNLPFEVIHHWEQIVLRVGTFAGTPGNLKIREHYLKKLTDEDLATAEEPYRTVYRLNWFTHLCGGREGTVKEIIIGMSTFRACPYCDRFLPKNARKNQVTCGSKQCEMAHKNKHKREMRKLGIYKP